MAHFRTTSTQNVIPPGTPPQRQGYLQILTTCLYDTPLMQSGPAPAVPGPTTTLRQSQKLFADGQRINNDELCNVTQPGMLGSEQQVAIHAIGMQCFFADYALYHAFIYYSFLKINVQSSQKLVTWTDQAGAGGGVFGQDTQAGAGTGNATNGNPISGNWFHLSEPIIVLPNRTFDVTLDFVQAPPGMLVAPVDQINASDGEKLVRIYLMGTVGRDIVNG